MTQYRIVARRTRVFYWPFVILWSLLCGALRLGFDGRMVLARLVVTFVISHSLFVAPPSSPPVHSPADEAASFKFAEPGYHIELVASEPLVEEPSRHHIRRRRPTVGRGDAWIHAEYQPSGSERPHWARFSSGGCR